MSVLMHTYRNDILPELRTKRDYGNVQEVPKITKIVVSSGIGSDKDREVFDEALRTLSDIVGQRPMITKAKISVAGFKLRVTSAASHRPPSTAPATTAWGSMSSRSSPKSISTK